MYLLLNFSLLQKIKYSIILGYELLSFRFGNEAAVQSPSQLGFSRKLTLRLKFTCLFIQLVSYLPIYLFTHSLTPSFIHSFIHSFIYLFIYLFFVRLFWWPYSYITQTDKPRKLKHFGTLEKQKSRFKYGQNWLLAFG